MNRTLNFLKKFNLTTYNYGNIITNHILKPHILRYRHFQYHSWV